jgi:hypothetical protein
MQIASFPPITPDGEQPLVLQKRLSYTPLSYATVATTGVLEETTFSEHSSNTPNIPGTAVTVDTLDDDAITLLYNKMKHHLPSA